MKKLIILSFICAAGVIACGKKMMPESDANNPSKPANDKSAKSESQPGNTSNTNTSDNGLPSFGNMQKTMPSGQAETQAEKLDKGKTVYLTKCGSCHALKNIRDFTADRWNEILKAEIPRAKLSNDEGNQVTAFIMAKANK